MGPQRLVPAIVISALFKLALAHSASQITSKWLISGADLASQLEELSKFSDDPAPAVTRVLFTQHDVDARKYVKSLMKDAYLTIREDAMGNIWGRWTGSDASEGAVVTGSHCDAIPLAGRYDGTLGVLGGIAAIKGLQAAGFTPRKSIEVLFFTSEEPTRFGLGCIGSRAMAGTMTPEFLEGKVDANGTTFQEAANAVGYGGESHKEILERSKVGKGKIAAFVELHIEQGPLLEREGLDIGVVTAIAAPAAFRIQFNGGGGHAGALLMPDRHEIPGAVICLLFRSDRAVIAGLRHVLKNLGKGHAKALLMPDQAWKFYILIRVKVPSISQTSQWPLTCMGKYSQWHDAALAAAEVALHLEQAATTTGSIDSVATTGAWHIKSNTINSVPKEARIEVDIRDIDLARRDAVVESLLQKVKAVSQQRGLQYKIEQINQDPPTACADQIIAAVEKSAKTLGLSQKRLVSRAYHDSLFMAQIAPAGMIFVPCKNGWSHRPDEFTSAQNIENGVKTLALTLAELAGTAPDSRTEL